MELYMFLKKVVIALSIALPTVSFAYASQMESQTPSKSFQELILMQQNLDQNFTFENKKQTQEELKNTPQDAGKDLTWIALDSSQEKGSKAKLIIDSKQSSTEKTVVDLVIPGFWVDTQTGENGEKYHRINIPGLGTYGEEGSPMIPVFRFDLVVPQSEKLARLEVVEKSERQYSGVNMLPMPIEAADGEKDKFYINEKIYGDNNFFPKNAAVDSYKTNTMLRSIPSISAQVHPVSWNPQTQEMVVSSKTRYQIYHAGEKPERGQLTQQRAKLAEIKFHNWEIFKDWYQVNWFFYTGSYLFVYPDDDHRDELLPLINQKKARGFKVSELKVDDIGSNCNDIRNAINQWEAKVPFYHDAYTLLVGDTDVIPHCTSPGGDQTDDLYATTNGDDLNEEIFLGRLSIDDEADLQNQVNKILTYEDNPAPFCCYHRAGLWAHKENAPGKYVGAHETVRTNSYSVAPTFSTHYGSVAGVTDSDIVNRVDAGVGVLAYRGHGSSSSTATGWNQTSEFFNSNDATLLSNATSRSPIVWSFACTNSRLDSNDSIAEVWMEQVDSGSVSYYGATRTSGTSANHVLDEWMFNAVYDEGLVTQSHAIERAEDQMVALQGSSWATRNAWSYLMLGDPDLQIRRRNPKKIFLDLPEFIERCPLKTCYVQALVLDETGKPMRNSQVTLWKDAKGENELQINRYTNQEGEVKIPYSNLTSGKLLLNVRDDSGNTLNASIDVK